MAGPVSGEIVAGANALRSKTQDLIDSKRGKKRTFGFGKKKDKSADQAENDALKAEIEMDEHKISIEELLTRFNTNLDTGLTGAQAATVLQQVGLNRLTPPETTPWWVLLLATQTGFFSLLLWFGSVLCFVGYSLKNEQENLYLGIVLALVVTLTGIFSFFQEQKSSNLMDSFKNMMPSSTQVIRDGKASEIDALNLVPGDLIKLKFGDKVPADVRVIECSDDMKVDNASLTGESEPCKRENKCTHENPLETNNLCFFGTLVPTGTAKCVVIATGDKTLMGRIARLSLTTENVETPIAKEIEHFVMIVSAVAIFLGVTFFIIGALLGTDWLTNLVFMIGIIVANVPEGLLATVTVCLTLTAKRMHSKSVLVKNLEGVETLGSTSCICSDKTGTLTQNIMTVAQIVYDLKIWDVESTMAKANFNDQDSSFLSLLRCATLCNTAVWDDKSQKDASGKAIPFEAEVEMGDGSLMRKIMWKPLGDASESAMIKFAQSKVDIMEERKNNPLNDRGKIPFNSANKYQAHVNWVESLGQYVCLVKGAPERVTSRCKTILIDGEEIPITAEHIAQIDDLQLQLSRRGMRVLGFAEKRLSLDEYPKDYAFDSENVNYPLGESDDGFQARVDLATSGGADAPHENVKTGLCYVGMMALIDPPRPQVPPAVAKCKTAGIKVIMVTGDHPETAKAISKKVGIIWGDTQDDIEFRNEAAGLKEGDAGWEDPHLAPAIVVPGWDISVDTAPEVWDDILAHPQVVFARTSPQQKLVIVENCQRRRHVVAVTGDGVNDSPALKKADIGVAMGIMGTDVSKEAADMILLDDNFASIVSGVEEGRLIFDNLKKSIAYTLSSNIPEISPFLAFIVVQIPLPLSTVLILCVDLGTDMVPAISMAWENPEADIMARNPRDADLDRLVTRKLVSFAYLQIGVIQALSGFYTYLTVLNDFGFAPWLLPGLGGVDNWGKQQLYCQLENGAWKNYGGEICPCFVDPSSEFSQVMCNDVAGPFWSDAAVNNKMVSQCQKMGYTFWDQDAVLQYVNAAGESVTTDKGSVTSCKYPMKNLFKESDGFKGVDGDFKINDASTYYNADNLLDTAGYRIFSRGSIEALRGNDLCKDAATAEGCLHYFEYNPFRAVRSQFFKRKWSTFDVLDSDVVGLGKDVLRSVAMQYQPIGFWDVVESSEDDSRSVNVGHILDTIDISTASTNPAAIKDTTFTNGVLDLSNNVESIMQLSTNELENSFWADFVTNSTNPELATTMLQALRCQNSCTSQPGFLKLIMEADSMSDSEIADYMEEMNPDCGLEVFNNFKTAIASGKVMCYDDLEADRLLTNVASRQLQKESLHAAQCASFIGIIIVQWADLVICKTRWLSIRAQGMRNSVMNFALVFELLLGAFLCYILEVGVALGTRPLRITHWFPAMPFSVFIFTYDELRKYFMRETSTIETNKVTGRTVRHPGWLERNTYY